jgi:hypothetical protein
MLALGAGAAFLFGTEDGRRVRRQLLVWADDLQRRLAEAQEILETARELFQGDQPGQAATRPMRIVGRG